MYFDFYGAIEQLRGNLRGNTINGKDILPRRAESYVKEIENIERRLSRIKREIELLLNE